LSIKAGNSRFWIFRGATPDSSKLPNSVIVNIGQGIVVQKELAFHQEKQPQMKYPTIEENPCGAIDMHRKH
jgi:acyl CoA:acetate/3-ketoacid CoA transferase